MPLSWNEIKARAATFVNNWKDNAHAREEADAQTFENEFFNIFGVNRRQVALFEKKVKLHANKGQTDLFGDTSAGPSGYIDLFWEGHILIEMKTPGKDMTKAYEQARRYALALSKEVDMPRGILICDFVTFHYYNLQEDGKLYQFNLSELVDHIELFGDLAEYKEIDPYKRWDPVNIEAAEKMGKLHDRLKEIGYQGHQLELYLVRLLFCLFADDTGIFDPPNIFNKYIMERTSEDGSDLALHLAKIFEVLNKPKPQRLKTIDEQLNLFPYVNGKLFEERLETADFDRPMRDTLLECCSLDWSKISPAIFGAMFQSVMNDEERHDIGAHYTSEENILKLIRPLFLDGLWDEFNKIKALNPANRESRLIEFHNKISKLKFLDPACGCGNFLVISYRELRLLELEILKILLGDNQVLDVSHEIKVNVDQFYGIEIEEFPAQIAQVAMWLTDHQLNMAVREMFGQYFVRIPLIATATILCTNSLTVDWESIVPKNELSYILGNPPFLGARIMNKVQKGEVEHIFHGMKDCSNIDYVSCWYKKAAEYIQGTEIEVAYVSTNSICQGEQVPILWPELLGKHGVKINFAHQTFKWSNEARGKAAVYCVIIGLGLNDHKIKKLYHYATVTSEPVEIEANQINAYLIDGPIVYIVKNSKPICKVPEMVFGNMPNDGGNLTLTLSEKEALIKADPSIADLILPFVGADEFINNIPRFCIWLKGVSPAKYKTSKPIQERIKNVKELRENSTREATQKLAEFPTLFGEIRQPDTDYIIIPRHSSERRKYIPIGFLSKDIIVGDSNIIIPNATLYDFGILTSAMHMAWMRYVCGRLKSDYRYSASIVYNNFPWPTATDKQKKEIEKAAQEVLNARGIYPDLSLAVLYDSDNMIPELVKAHQKLDKLVEQSYGKTFTDDAARVAHLFELYQKMTGELFVETKQKKGRRK
ncbi:methylase [Spirochaetia bacterium]|nr:methylase [Spirochaetia bacterium]